MDHENIIETQDLFIEYKMKKYALKAVSAVNFHIKKGTITALVGESGSGKTTLASSLLSCITSPGEITQGKVLYWKGEKPLVINELKDAELRKFRWSEISMVFQSAQSALNPILTVFEQFFETAKAHNPQVTKEEVVKKMQSLLNYVNLDYDRVSKAYPHELSGGMKQRVMLAFSMLLDPKLIILDEPTTALDVITQDYIFRILKKINREMGISMLLLTHDISVVAKFSDYVAVMYAGRIMEYGTVKEVFKEQLHPYTEALIRATPALDKDIAKMESIPGASPDINNLPKGCKFAPRCSYAKECCFEKEPADQNMNDIHTVKCYKVGESWTN